jgi:hypothetical protein
MPVDPVRFAAANAIHLERFLGLAKLVQYEECSEIPKGEPKAPKALSNIMFGVGRIVLPYAEAPKSVPTMEQRKLGGHIHSKRVELMGGVSVDEEESFGGGKQGHGRIERRVVQSFILLRR